MSEWTCDKCDHVFTAQDELFSYLTKEHVREYICRACHLKTDKSDLSTWVKENGLL